MVDFLSLPYLCYVFDEYQSIARVFTQSMLGTSEFYLSCIEFYLISYKGTSDLIVNVYIDKTGGKCEIQLSHIL